jgi:hypothetical protein
MLRWFTYHKSAQFNKEINNFTFPQRNRLSIHSTSIEPIYVAKGETQFIEPMYHMYSDSSGSLKGKC